MRAAAGGSLLGLEFRAEGLPAGIAQLRCGALLAEVTGKEWSKQVVLDFHPEVPQDGKLASPLAVCQDQRTGHA